jgi:hypothetical protein
VADSDLERLQREWAELKRAFWAAIEPPLTRFVQLLDRAILKASTWRRG